MEKKVLRVYTGPVSGYAARIDWMIWNMADPQTTNTKSVSSQGPTGDWSSLLFWNIRKGDREREGH